MLSFFRNTFRKCSGLKWSYRNRLQKCSGLGYCIPEHFLKVFRNSFRNTLPKCSGLGFSVFFYKYFYVIIFFRMPRRLGPDGRLPRRNDNASGSGSHPPEVPRGFPGGPSYLSLLVRYEQHCARHLWYGEVSK